MDMILALVICHVCFDSYVVRVSDMLNSNNEKLVRGLNFLVPVDATRWPSCHDNRNLQFYNLCPPL